MAKSSVFIYDETGKRVTELPYGQNGITGKGTGEKGQTVVQVTDKNGNQTFAAPDYAAKTWSGDQGDYNDPFLTAANEIEYTLSSQIPKVKISGNDITISAPQEVLSSPLTAQIKKELQTLKGADLSSPETAEAVAALNDNINKSVRDYAYRQGMGWKPEEYDDYQHTLQTVRTNNPMASSNLVKGTDKFGVVQKKTPKEWEDYYRSAYNTEERGKAFKESLYSKSPYERTMALILGAGGKNPVYGFDFAEKGGQFWTQLVEESKKFPEGVTAKINIDSRAFDVENYNNDLKIPLNEFQDFSVTNEGAFDERKNSIEGKTWGELSDKDRAFVLLVGASKQKAAAQELKSGKRLTDDDLRLRDKAKNSLDYLASDKGYEKDESKYSISNILSDSSYDDYKTTRNEFDTYSGYQKDTNKEEEDLEENRIWSGQLLPGIVGIAPQDAGKFAGTLARMAWEEAVLTGATGGVISLNGISGTVSDGLIKGLSKIGVAPASRAGKTALKFSTELLGSIPEDIAQDAVDNAITENPHYMDNMLSPEYLAETFNGDLAYLVLASAIKKGYGAIKYSKLLKKLEKQADLDTKIDIGAMGEDVADVAKTYANGGKIDTDGQRVVLIDRNGAQKELKNTTPDQAVKVKNLMEGKTPSSSNPEIILPEGNRGPEVILPNGRRGPEVILPEGGRTSSRSTMPITYSEGSGPEVILPEGRRNISGGNTPTIYSEGSGPEIILPDGSMARANVSSSPEVILPDGSRTRSSVSSAPETIFPDRTGATSRERGATKDIIGVPLGSLDSLGRRVLIDANDYMRRFGAEAVNRLPGGLLASPGDVNVVGVTVDELIDDMKRATGETYTPEKVKEVVEEFARETYPGDYNVLPNEFYRGNRSVLSGWDNYSVLSIGNKTKDGKTILVDAKDYNDKFGLDATTRLPRGMLAMPGDENVVPMTIDELVKEASEATGAFYNPDSIRYMLDLYARDYSRFVPDGNGRVEIIMPGAEDYSVLGIGRKTSDGKIVGIDAEDYNSRFGFDATAKLPRGMLAVPGDENMVAMTIDDLIEEANRATGATYTPDMIKKMIDNYADDYAKFVPEGGRPEVIFSDGSREPEVIIPEGSREPEIILPDGSPLPEVILPDGERSPETISSRTSAQDSPRQTQEAVPTDEVTPSDNVPDNAAATTRAEANGEVADQSNLGEAVQERVVASTEADSQNRLPKENGVTGRTVEMDIDTPDGKKTVPTPEVNIDSFEKAVDPSTHVEATPAGIRHFWNRAMNAVINAARNSLFKEFSERFGDVTADDFDWIFHNSKKGLSPDKIIGTRNPKTGRIVDQNMIDAARWWGEHPIIKGLRMASRKALGEAGDENILGYLPHTNYDPSVLPFEEAKTGQLWQTYTGKSMMNGDEYIGYGGTLEGRFRTYASNMLWDSRAREVAAAKLVEEAAMEGKTITSGEAMKMADGWKKIDDGVQQSKSSKAYAKGATSDGDSGMDDFKAATQAVEKEAPNSGISYSINKNFPEMYFGSGRGNVEQPERLGKLGFSIDTQGETMRKIKVNGVSMYDAGGADLVYAVQNAIEVVTRWGLEGGDPAQFRNMLIEYITTHSQRTKYAEQIADKWIARIVKESGGRANITKGSTIRILSKCMRSDAFNRLRRWITLADFSQFDKSTVKFMDNFLYRHMQIQGISNNKSIIKMLANAAMELRYDALFYGNFKNALLQLSELSRLATVYKWRDIGSMMKELATNAEFRARVDMYINVVAPQSSMDKALIFDKYGEAADSMEVGKDGVSFKKLREKKKLVDDIALAPIDTAEAIKNRTIVAALVSEADRLNLKGEEALMYIRQRFERVALAQNEMGKIGMSTNPFAKTALFLQNFQLRELGMHYYNIMDPIDLSTGKSMKTKRGINAIKYLTKVLGTKLGLTFVLARLGYSAAQTMGLDPLGVTGNYTGLSEEEKTAIDEQISNGLLTPLVAGGMTSLFSDIYFMAREAFEDANRSTISEDAESRLDNNPFERFATPKSFEDGSYWGEFFSGFAPGSTFANRIGQMNDMMSSGWAVSNTGNKMYTAPDNSLDMLMGYLFGRNATQNAQQYRQLYGNNIPQTLGRFWNQMTGGDTLFDPIDTQNYSDWFDGSGNDAQQFEKGRRYFQRERDRILDAYEESLRENYGDLEEAEAKNDMNQKLDELYGKVERFVDAYEKENGNITGGMVKQLVNLLNTDRASVSDSNQDDSEKGLDQYSKALERYAQLGLPNVGYYKGPQTDDPATSEDESKREVVYKGSPQWQVASKGRYTLIDEATAVLEAAGAPLKDLRDEYKGVLSAAYDKKDYDEVERIQKEYLKSFDSAIAPVLATYGSGILSDEEVVSALKEMLSTGSSSQSADFVPRDDWARGTNNRYISTKRNPLAGVNLKKWLQQRYSGDVFKKPTIRSSSTAEDDVNAIKRLYDSGNKDLARARALSLKVRIDNQKRSLGKNTYKWLLDFLNNGGQ